MNKDKFKSEKEKGGNIWRIQLFTHSALLILFSMWIKSHILPPRSKWRKCYTMTKGTEKSDSILWWVWFLPNIVSANITIRIIFWCVVGEGGGRQRKNKQWCWFVAYWKAKALPSEPCLQKVSGWVVWCGGGGGGKEGDGSITLRTLSCRKSVAGPVMGGGGGWEGGQWKHYPQNLALQKSVTGVGGWGGGEEGSGCITLKILSCRTQ